MVTCHLSRMGLLAQQGLPGFKQTGGLTEVNGHGVCSSNPNSGLNLTLALNLYNVGSYNTAPLLDYKKKSLFPPTRFLK